MHKRTEETVSKDSMKVISRKPNLKERQKTRITILNNQNAILKGLVDNLHFLIEENKGEKHLEKGNEIFLDCNLTLRVINNKEIGLLKNKIAVREEIIEIIKNNY